MLWSLLAVLAISTVGCSDDDEVVAPEPQPEPGVEMTFTLEASNITATTADLKVTPSVETQTYAASTLPAAMLDKAGEDAVINAAIKMVKPEELVKGELSFKAEELKPETEYIIFAVGIENGKATTKLAYKRFTTLAEEAKPEVPQQNNEGKVVELTAETFAQWIYDYKTDSKKEHFLSEIPAVIDFYGPGCGEHLVPIFDELAAEYNGKINFFRFNFTKPEHKEVREYMEVTLCPTLGFMQQGKAPVMLGDEISNAITTNELMRAEIEKHLGIKSEVQPDPEAPADAPQFELRAAKGDSKGEAAESFYTIFFKAQTCVAFYDIALPAAEVDEMIQKGFTLPQIIYCLGNKELDDFCTPLREGKEVAIEYGGLTAGEKYSFLAQVVDANGARVTRRLDFVVNGESNLNGVAYDRVGDNIDGATSVPTVEIEGWLGDEQKANPAHNMTFVVKSANALKVRYALFTKADYDDFLSKVPQEQLMTDLGSKLSPVLVKDQMNTSEGWGISYSELPGGTTFVFVIWASNGAGDTFETMSMMTEASGEGPAVEIEGWPGDIVGEYQDSKATIHVICREAASMKYSCGPKKDIDGLLNSGTWTIEMLLDTPGLGNVLSEERMQNLRSPEGEYFVYGAKVDQTFLYSIRNEGGDVTLGRYDIEMPAK